MLEVSRNQIATLVVTFENNGILFDPISVGPVQVFDPTHVIIATITPVRVVTGRWVASYFVGPTAAVGIWEHHWTWQASLAVPSISQTYQFKVLGTPMQGLIQANFVGFGECGDHIWSEGSDATVVTLQGIPKRMKIFFLQDNVPFNPGVISAEIRDAHGNPVYSGSLLTGEVKKEADGIFYLDSPTTTPNLTGTAPNKFMFVWQYSTSIGSEGFFAVSYLYVMSNYVYGWMPRFRLQIDKAVKLVDKEFIGFTNGELYYYLQGGVEEINTFPPVTNFTLDGYPSEYGQLLINSATVVGLISQKLYAVDTDVTAYADQGFSYTLDHFARLNTVMTELLAHIQDQMNRFKMEFSQIGSITVQVVPYYPMSVLLKTAPRGSIFRNLFVSS